MSDTALLLLFIFSLSEHLLVLVLLGQDSTPSSGLGIPHIIISIGSVRSKAAWEHKSAKAGRVWLAMILPRDNILKFFTRPGPHKTCLPAATEKGKVEVQVRCSVS